MIRRAEKKDIDRLNELLFQVQGIHAAARPDIFKCGAKKYTTQELEAIIENDMTPIFVSELDGVVAGYAFCIYQITEENTQLNYRKTLYIDDLCIDKAFRRQHIGETLYRYVLQTAAENGCHAVTLNVWSLNDGAAEFYRRMGMIPLKTTMETPISNKSTE